MDEKKCNQKKPRIFGINREQEARGLLAIKICNDRSCSTDVGAGAANNSSLRVVHVEVDDHANDLQQNLTK